MSKKCWLIILLILLLIIIAIFIKCCQPEEPVTIVGSVSKATMVTAATTGDSCLYLSVQNDSTNLITHAGTEVFSAVEFYTMPILKYRSYWVIRNSVDSTFVKLDSIISAMDSKYPNWKSMKVLVTSIDSLHRIESALPENYMEIAPPDPNPESVPSYVLFSLPTPPPPLPGIKEEPILKSFIEAAGTPIYITVCNTVENKLDYSTNTTITPVLDVNLIPDDVEGQFRRHWKILVDPVDYDGATPSEILTIMNSAYIDPPGPDWLSLKIIASSNDSQFRIEAVNPGDPKPEVTIKFVDPNQESLSFNNWGELDENEISDLKNQ